MDYQEYLRARILETIVNAKLKDTTLTWKGLPQRKKIYKG